MAIKRTYSKEFTIGDILFNNKTNSVYFFLKGGFFGTTKINLVKNDGGTYDLFKPYVDAQGKPNTVKIGKTFEVTKRDQTVVEGLTRGTLGLSTTWNAEIKKEVVSSENALFFTTHKLKEPKAINEDLVKVGWVTGVYGVEVPEETQTSAA